jgi:hypothetical protein
MFSRPTKKYFCSSNMEFDIRAVGLLGAPEVIRTKGHSLWVMSFTGRCSIRKTKLCSFPSLPRLLLVGLRENRENDAGRHWVTKPFHSHNKSLYRLQSSRSHDLDFFPICCASSEVSYPFLQHTLIILVKRGSICFMFYNLCSWTFEICAAKALIKWSDCIKSDPSQKYAHCIVIGSGFKLKAEGRWLDFLWDHWSFKITQSLQSRYGSGPTQPITEASTRNVPWV